MQRTRIALTVSPSKRGTCKGPVLLVVVSRARFACSRLGRQQARNMHAAVALLTSEVQPQQNHVLCFIMQGVRPANAFAAPCLDRQVLLRSDMGDQPPATAAMILCNTSQYDTNGLAAKNLQGHAQKSISTCNSACCTALNRCNSIVWYPGIPGSNYDDMARFQTHQVCE
jgi:hypothetical protein